MKRHALASLPLLALCACFGDKDDELPVDTCDCVEDSDPQDTDADTDTDADSDTDADADADADADSDADTDTEPRLDGAVIGEWFRSLQKGPTTVTIEWNGYKDGSCDVRVVEHGEAPIACSWFATDGVFTIEDADCGAAVGTYNYTVTGPTLTFTLDSDDCTERAWIIESEWTRGD
jgi:hypothetical protein